eukprot:11615413-Alexandrium_andersonii.AAC.1
MVFKAPFRAIPRSLLTSSRSVLGKAFYPDPLLLARASMFRVACCSPAFAAACNTIDAALDDDDRILLLSLIHI